MAKITTRLQNKYHGDLSENQAVWQSDNQVLKEATFIQMDRSGGNSETCREVQKVGEEEGGMETESDKGRHGDMVWLIPHPLVLDKSWEEYLRSEGS